MKVRIELCIHVSVLSLALYSSSFGLLMINAKYCCQQYAGVTVQHFGWQW